MLVAIKYGEYKLHALPHFHFLSTVAVKTQRKF